MTTPLSIGTRGSRLAIRQSRYIAERLQALDSSRPIVVFEIQTAGDQAPDAPLAQIGGQGAFTKEIQRALLNREIDLAVHSLKDLPTWPVEGLVLAAVPERGPVGDVFVSHGFESLDRVPAGGVIATGSLRRQAQLRRHRPDLHIIDIRGNVETRLRKMEQQELAGLILAQAGLERLNLTSRIREILDPSWMLPAVGQGALGLECRVDDHATRALVGKIDHISTHLSVLSERTVLRELGGGCQVPIGVLTGIAGSMLSLRAVVLDPLGQERIEAENSDHVENAENLGRAVSAELRDRGAERLLRRSGG